MDTRVLRWLPLPVLLLGALGSWGLSQGPAPGAENPSVAAPPSLPVIEVEVGVLRPIVRTHGSVAPLGQVVLVAEVSGRVRAISPSLQAGDFFHAGEILVEIDRVDAELALERAEAQVMRRRSQKRLAEAKLARLRSLVARDVASPVEIEEALHESDLASAGLREVVATRAQARRDLDRTRIALPFDGRVRERAVEVGLFVTRGMPLATVYSVEAAEVRLPLSRVDFALLELPIVDAPGTGRRVTLRARHGDSITEWRARLVRAEGEISARTRMRHVVARIEDPYARRGGSGGPPLTVGLFVEAEIEGRAIAGAIALPRSSLQGDSRVWVVDPDNRVRARRVESVHADGEWIWIASGLASGERVVVSAAAAVEGARVRAVPITPNRPASLAARAR